MSDSDVIILSSLEELFDMELKKESIIDLRAIKSINWKEVIPKLVPLLSTNLISLLYVPGECYAEVVGRVKSEVFNIFRRKFGENLIMNGRVTPLHRFFKSDFLLCKIVTTRRCKKDMKQLKMFWKSMNNINSLYDMCPSVKDLISNASKSIQKRTRKRYQLFRNTSLLKRDEIEESSAGKKRKIEARDEVQDILQSRMIKSKKSRRHFRSTISELAKITPTPQCSDNDHEMEEEGGRCASRCYICSANLSLDNLTGSSVNQRLCRKCDELNQKMRFNRCDLTGKFAVITGARLKIGYEAALKLLRDGCYVIATTRFPNDAALRYSKEPDYQNWSGKLKIYPLDLLDIASVYRFVGYVRESLPHLDILINNAAQTISRPIGFYRHLFPLENADPTSIDAMQQKLVVPGVRLFYPQTPMAELKAPTIESCDDSMKGLEQADNDCRQDEHFVTFSDEKPFSSAMKAGTENDSLPKPLSGEEMKNSMEPEGSELEAKCQHSSPTIHLSSNFRDASVNSSKRPLAIKYLSTKDISQYNYEEFPEHSFDKDGQQVDLRQSNSWKYKLDDVPFKELLDVITINTLGPFTLVSQLRPWLRRSPGRVKFVVNVSAMEGQFHRKYKSCDHPHTNMAKAALNMLTRTSGIELKKEGIFMTAVDTGWVTDERPKPQADYERVVHQFEVPLDCIDGASRIYHPIVHGLNPKEKPYFAVFLKDYKPHPW